MQKHLLLLYYDIIKCFYYNFIIYTVGIQQNYMSDKYIGGFLGPFLWHHRFGISA